ncbi:MAG: hypothetical protein H7Z12_01210 [Rhodospirillaceae bacterium]|nr:hypothetical protein [Rhodospirillales bacterium]
MSEQDNNRNEMSEADVIMGKRILYSVVFIGAVLLVSLALPRIMERF